MPQERRPHPSDMASETDVASSGEVDFYADNAEWYGALVAPSLEATSAAVRRLLGDLAGGDVIELGAGIGTCLPVLASLGAGRIFAVEPSPSMRIGLMATLATDPELRRRTTILPGDLAGQLRRLPGQWSGAVMLNAIGHLDDGARGQLWRTLAEQLRPGARFVLTLQPPDRVSAIPWTDFGSVAVGEDALRTRGRADPVDDHHVAWTMEWSLHDADGALLDRRSARSRWRVLAVPDIAEEAGAAGLRVVDHVTEVSALALAAG